MAFLRWLLSPLLSVFYVTGSLWNRSADWGWHISLRLIATILVFALFLFFFVWAFFGFQWPLFGK
jgi:hypothetical protein